MTVMVIRDCHFCGSSCSLGLPHENWQIINVLKSLMNTAELDSEEITALSEEEMQRLDQIMAALNAKAPLPQEEYRVAEMWEQFRKDHADAFTRQSES